MKKLLAALMFLCCSQFAHADLSESDAKKIGVVIVSMFDALHKDDAQAMYALQTDDTKGTFKTAAEFDKMLKDSIPVLFDAKEEYIVGAAQSGIQVGVVMMLIDSDGDRWQAIFVFENNDGWKIDAIHVKQVEKTARKELKV